MKPVTLLLISLLSTPLLYADLETFTIPKKIEKQLCQKLSKKGCTSKQSLHPSYYFKISPNKRLFFFQLNYKDGLYHRGYQNVPALVNNKGKWKVIDKIIDAEIQEIRRDPNGDLWLRTLWMIEGVSPFLYYSHDAEQWKEIKFPKNRPSSGAFEDMELCLLDKNIELTFRTLDNDEHTKTWSAPYKSAYNKSPKWEPLNYKKVCLQTSLPYKDNWNIQRSREGLTLKLESMKKITSIQCDKLNYYTVQLGAFQYRESLTSVSNDMKELNQYLQSKSFHSGTKTTYKLYLGSFSTKEEAEKQLKKWRNFYKKNKHLKNALVKKVE